MKKYILVLFMLHIGIGGSLFSNDIINGSDNDLCCKEKKHYVNSEKILIDKNQMFLINDLGSLIPLSNLFQDEDGIYISDNSFSKKLNKVWNIAWCSFCADYCFFDINGNCYRCGNKIVGGN